MVFTKRLTMFLKLMRIFPPSIMVVTETYGKYITHDSQKITPHEFPNAKVVTGKISIKKPN